jgi:hypothetical protein
MKYKSLLIGLLSSLVTVLFVSTYSAQAANKSPRGYWVDSSGTIVRSGTGLCVRTGTWVPADAVVPGCDGVPLQSVEPVKENKTAQGTRTNFNKETGLKKPETAHKNKVFISANIDGSS